MNNISKDDIESIISVLRSAVHGDKYGPTGMESIAMALAGDGISNDVGSGLHRVAEAIEATEGTAFQLGEIAEAITNVSLALHAVAAAIRGEQ